MIAFLDEFREELKTTCKKHHSMPEVLFCIHFLPHGRKKLSLRQDIFQKALQKDMYKKRVIGGTQNFGGSQKEKKSHDIRHMVRINFIVQKKRITCISITTE